MKRFTTSLSLTFEIPDHVDAEAASMAVYEALLELSRIGNAFAATEEGDEIVLVGADANEE